jgi:hypothetical protein
MTGRPGTLSPDDVVAAFDSATVLHGGLASALRGQPFPHLGNSSLAAAATRVGGRLPWSVLRGLYTRIGAAEGIDPDRLADVDMGSVARWLTDAYPSRRYPAAFVGSSNGALAHLAAAMQVPWLPGTVLVPVARVADPARPVDALEFGRRHAPEFLAANPDVALHHMHDQIQDELMVARMTYFRTKWATLPQPYADFLARDLADGAPVVLVEDTSPWPVVRVSERHVFQPGAQGGVDPEGYRRRPHTPIPDDEAPEAEWGADPGLGRALETWCALHGHPLVRLAYRGPQAPAHAVARVMRGWYRDRGEPADRLLVPSFVLGDPWRTLSTASVPYWTFFSVQAALDALDDHLARADPYREVDVLLFQHGADSLGIARPADWEAVVRKHGATPRLLALDRSRFPHDIAINARYDRVLAELPRARHPWSPLSIEKGLAGLEQAGLLTVRA